MFSINLLFYFQDLAIWNETLCLFPSFSGVNLIGNCENFRSPISSTSNFVYCSLGMIKVSCWESSWFLVLLGLFFLGIVCFVSCFYVFVIKRREEARIQQFNQEANLQMKSLKNQLDPHFIFNALNSIQSYILDGKKENALDYLSDFSNVLRKKIEHANCDFISLSEEIEYLRLYLKLEQMRFPNKFTFHIQVDKTINLHEFKLPAMLIHPFLENAIKYGLSGSEDNGILSLTFELKDDGFLNCTITDNGCGRKKSKDMQESSSIKKQYKTLDIIRDRMSLLNKMHAEGRRYSYLIQDLVDENGLAKGTLVEITIPKKID